ncbi:hypothetical protein MHTCC0001_28640 [Flavobacteriaceae bacterium MHTCC 0001]
MESPSAIIVIKKANWIVFFTVPVLCVIENAMIPKTNAATDENTENLGSDNTDSVKANIEAIIVMPIHTSFMSFYF